MSAILVAGTTGENATLEIHEYSELVDFSIRRCYGKAKVFVGIGGNNSSSCLKKARLAAEAGADGVLMTPPYYNKASAQGLIKHFLSVADNVCVPLILYNVPSRTSIGIDFDCYKSLAAHPNINGTKEASGNISLITKLLAKLSDELNVWSGNDDNTIPLMSMGAKGVISVFSNILPLEMVKICSMCKKGDYVAAFELHKKYAELMEALFMEVNPIPIKTAMKQMGMDRGVMRLPLTELSAEKHNALCDTLEAYGLIKNT